MYEWVAEPTCRLRSPRFITSVSAPGRHFFFYRSVRVSTLRTQLLPFYQEDANHRVSSSRRHLRYVPRGSNLTLAAYKVHSFPITFQTCEDKKIRKGKSDSEERAKWAIREQLKQRTVSSQRIIGLKLPPAFLGLLCSFNDMETWPD